MTTATDPAHTQPTPTDANIHYQKSSTAARLQALAPTLKEAELRACLYFAAAAEQSPRNTTRASSRQIAAATGLARSKVLPALNSLVARGLITRRAGDATTAAAYLVNFLQTIEITPSGGGPLTGPPPSQTGPPKGAPELPFGDQPLVPFRDHPGPAKGPPLTQNQHPAANTPALDLKYDQRPIVDRVLHARPRDFTPELIAKAREWLLGYRRKLGNTKTCHAPDDLAIAQFLTLGDWPDLERMLLKLFEQRIPPGDNDAWFITVGLNRLHSITPAAIRQRRAELKLVRAAPDATADDARDFAADLTHDLAAKIGGIA